jgi:hypothetical protein
VCDDRVVVVAPSAARDECSDLIAKRAAIELLQAAEATVWADSFSSSGRQVEELAVAALTFAFAVTAAGWRVEETARVAGSGGVALSTTAIVNEVMNRLTWLDDPLAPGPTNESVQAATNPVVMGGPTTNWWGRRVKPRRRAT